MTWCALPSWCHFDGDAVVDCIFIENDAARRETIVGRGVLRALLSMGSGIPPEAIRLTTDENGKPVAPDTGFHFNLSHGGGSLLIALCRSAAVGIDLEAERAVDDVADLTAFLHPEEKAAIDTAADPSRAFLSCWTRKEAVLKATGQGLMASLAGFRVTGDPSLPEGADWSLFDCSPRVGWVGAVAVMAPVRPRFWTFGGDRYSLKMESAFHA